MSKRISELPESTDLYEGCCIPVVTNGETKKFTFGLLVEKLKTLFHIGEFDIDTITESTNLNDLKTPGIYAIGASSWANVTKNYPVNNIGGTIEVKTQYDNNGNLIIVQQDYSGYAGSSDYVYNFSRHYYSPVGWSKWSPEQFTLIAEVPANSTTLNIPLEKIRCYREVVLAAYMNINKLESIFYASNYGATSTYNEMTFTRSVVFASECNIDSIAIRYDNSNFNTAKISRRLMSLKSGSTTFTQPAVPRFYILGRG